MLKKINAKFFCILKTMKYYLQITHLQRCDYFYRRLRYKIVSKINHSQRYSHKGSKLRDSNSNRCCCAKVRIL